MGGFASKNKDGDAADKGKNLRKDLPIVAHEFSLEVRTKVDEWEAVGGGWWWRCARGGACRGSSTSRKGQRAWRTARQLCSSLRTIAVLSTIGTPVLGRLVHLLPTPHPRLRPADQTLRTGFHCNPLLPPTHRS